MGPRRAINGSILAGTLGAVVIDNANNQHAAPTNFHVAAVDTSWHVGDRMRRSPALGGIELVPSPRRTRPTRAVEQTFPFYIGRRLDPAGGIAVFMP